MVLIFFFNDTATTEIYTLSLHDALPICRRAVLGEPMPKDERFADDVLEALRDAKIFGVRAGDEHRYTGVWGVVVEGRFFVDRKSTRLNSSHANISYAVFCLKKKKTDYTT